MEIDYSSIPVTDLHFDPRNPRIPAGIDPSDDQAVLDWMLQDAGLVELMGSIAVKGFFPAEPLLVTPREAESGYWVLEGNRRLAAVTLILEPERAPRRRNAVNAMAEQAVRREALRSLPSAIFQRREDVLDYLGYRHITGIKQWEPAAKARYLEELYMKYKISAGEGVYRKIARIIGSRADYVSRLLGALRLYELVVDDPEGLALQEEEVAFSLLTLSLNYSSVAAYLGLPSLNQEAFDKVDREKLRHLATWLYVEQPDLGRTQLGDSRNMKFLAASVGHEEGLEALLRGEPVEEAARATIDVDALFLRALRTSRDRLLSAQSLLHRVRVTDTDIETLEEVEELAGEMAVSARRRQRRSARTDV